MATKARTVDGKTLVKCEGCGEETAVTRYDSSIKYWCGDGCFNKYIAANKIKRVKYQDNGSE